MLEFLEMLLYAFQAIVGVFDETRPKGERIGYGCVLIIFAMTCFVVMLLATSR